MAFQEKQLGQLAPADTNAASIYSPAASITGVATDIIICNTTAIAATYRVFIDDNGTTYDATTALVYDKPLAANDYIVINTKICMSDSAGNIAVQTGTANALTFTINGYER